MKKNDKKLYISGKISAETPEEVKENLQRFNEKALELIWERGVDRENIFNPADLEVDGGTWEYYLIRDLTWIMEHRPAMYFMKGWGESRGARLEHELARYLGLKMEFEN